MYGDPDVLRRRADQLREQAVDVRTLADQLVARTESLGWSGRAAESMRLRICERADHLRSAASEHDTAADCLDKHTQELGRLKESITGLEHKATSLAADARTRAAQMETANQAGEASLRRVANAEDQALIDFTPPPTGHQDWLSVELPGL